MKPLASSIEEILPEVRELRRSLHAHPELGYEETETAKRVLEFLGDLPEASIQSGIAGTGIRVTFGEGRPGPGVALRADMDALAMEEKTGKPWASKVPGKMHACGHDGHTAMLAGAARLLAAREAELEGPVSLIFQPAEEGGAGGRALCEAGVLERPEVAAVFGLHNNLPGPGTKIGQIAYTEGAAMAGTGTFRIRIIGKGGHAAFPHRCIDPVYIGACLVEQLQGLVSRRVDPLAQAVLSVTTFQGGTADNIIPGDVTLRGTFRALDPRLLERLKVWIIERTEAVAAAHGATAEIRCELGYPVLFNDGKAARAFREVISELGWTDRLTEVPPNMGGEDFAYYSLQVPGFFYFLPACPEEEDEVPGCHSPFFDFNDDLLPIGMRLHVETALRFARIWSKTGEA